MAGQDCHRTTACHSASVHFIVNHFIGETGLLTYTDVIAYYQNPLIPIMEIFFLASVVTHSLIGLRGIILDLKPARNILKIIDWVLVIFGVSAVLYGTWLALTIASKGSLIHHGWSCHRLT